MRQAWTPAILLLSFVIGPRVSSAKGPATALSGTEKLAELLLGQELSSVKEWTAFKRSLYVATIPLFHAIAHRKSGVSQRAAVQSFRESEIVSLLPLVLTDSKARVALQRMFQCRHNGAPCSDEGTYRGCAAVLVESMYDDFPKTLSEDAIKNARKLVRTQLAVDANNEGDPNLERCLTNG